MLEASNRSRVTNATTGSALRHSLKGLPAEGNSFVYCPEAAGATAEAQRIAATRAAADRDLRDKLIAATHGNFQPGPGLDDVSPIRGRRRSP
jgi:hypothetical protein